MALKPDSPLQVGDWQYLPEQDKLVQFDPDGKIIATADLDNLSQKVANYFIVHAGKLVTKDELLLDVWGIRDVSDGRVTRVIRVLRVALGDDTREPRYIETIPKRGYRFIAPVSAIVPPESQDAAQPLTSNTAPQVKKRSNKPLLLGTAAVALLVMLLSWWFWPADTVGDNADTIPMLRYSPVTSLDGLEFYHNVSEDERYLVYSYASPEEENVTVLMLEDLKEHKRAQLTESAYSSFGAAFSPDGSQIIYQRVYPNGECDIRILDFNSDTFSVANDRQLLACGDNSISSRITWSPDGTYIVYPTMSDNRQTVLMLKRVASGAAEVLTTPPPTSFGDYVARFSNSGNKITFLREAAGSAQIWVLDLSSRETSMLVKVTDVLPGNIDWTNDDKYIVYPSAPTAINRVEVSTGITSVVAYTDFNALEIQIVKSNRVYASIGNFAHVNIKKVSNQITNPSQESSTVFSSNRNETLAEANPVAQGPTAVVSRRSGLPQVWLFYPNGEQKQITYFDKNERFRSLVFSPDGKKLLAQINNEIWLLSDVVPPIRLSDTSDNVIASPAWSHDGLKVYYAESKNGRWNIVSHEISDNMLMPGVFAVDRELYIESYDGKYSLWRDAISKKFYILWSDTQQVEEIPIALPENQLWLKVQTTANGIYFTYLLEDIKYSLKYYAFDSKKISDAVAVDYLYHSRFSLTPDENYIYILEAVRGDFDVAYIALP
ncbi:winged helix-turn-helix domain-containing protein [Rheinheimera sp. NSM]|uniref:winged helix-turn-helix domain-containing protein n=1 Tax=Rheinheimera sp. NSM TaxID=3457884 RepID=UPI0040356D1F